MEQAKEISFTEIMPEEPLFDFDKLSDRFD
jgi:hypothetical protein